MVRRIGERIRGLIPLKKLVYLISPSKIDRNFYASLDKVLSFKNVKFFQLRIKNVSQKKLLIISRKIKKITIKNKVKFIINDYFTFTSKIKADGCHMGQLDGSFKVAEKTQGKILGITCHNSKILANNAIENKADYIAFGSFLNQALNQVLKSKFKYFKMGKKILNQL